METTIFWQNDVHAFRREVERLSAEVRPEALRMAAAKFPLLQAINRCDIAFNAHSETFDIKQRTALMVGKPSGLMCDSNKRTVQRSVGREYPVQAWKPYADIELCMKSKGVAG